MTEKEETNDQRAERLVIELRATFTIEDKTGEDFVQFYSGSVKETQVFCLFRVFDEETWMAVLNTLLDFEAGQGFLLKVCKRYLKNSDKGLGYLWEVGIAADNLEEAVDSFRQIFMSCVHTVLGFDGPVPNHDGHSNVASAASGEALPAPLRLAPRPNRRRTPGDDHRGVIDPKSLNADGSFTARLPSTDGKLAAGFNKDRQKQVSGTMGGTPRDAQSFKVDRSNTRVRTK